MTLSDVTVSIEVQQSSASAGYGIPAYFVPGDTNTYKEYSTLESIQAAYKPADSVYGFATEYFAQPDHPQVMAVITFADLEEAMKLFDNKGWYFAILADEAMTKDIKPQNDTKVLTLSNIIESSQYRMMIVLDRYANADAIASDDVLKGNLDGNERTILMVKKSSTATASDAQRLDAALVGRYGAYTVGSLNWHDLIAPTMTADDWDAISLNAILKSGAMAFVNKANNVAQTTSGVTMSGQYIDVIMGIDWTGSNIKASLQNILTQSNKVPYDQAGIALLKATVEGVLAKAYTNGIIDADDAGQASYSVTAKDRSEMRESDQQARVFTGLSYQYVPANAIDQIKVFGAINM